MQSRIDIFRQMLESEPDNTMVMFGLAKEYEKLGEWKNAIDILEQYLAKADDEGNAYGTLAMAYAQTGQKDKAVETLRRGIDVSMAHGHPSMANEYKMTIDLDYGE
jgi:predicted Zn-dependent protease